MGKGKRTQETLEKARLLAEEKAQMEKRQKRKNRRTTILVSAGLTFFVLLSVGGTALFEYLVSNGTFLRNKKVYATENNTVNACMAQYFFNSAVQTYVSENEDSLEDMSLDTTKSLKDQICYHDSSISWHQYFMNSAKAQMLEVITLCEAAEKDGLKLNESDRKTVTDTVDAMEENAKDEGIDVEEYVNRRYGEKVNLQDIKDVLEMTALAGKYYSEYIENLEFSDTEISGYFDENKESFLTADFIYCEVSNNVSDDTPEAQISALNKAASKKAQKIADADSRKKFESNMTDYFEAYFKEQKLGLDKEQIEAQITSAISDRTVTDEPYSSDSELNQWIFSEERSTGDTTVIEDSENGIYYALYIVTPAKKDTTKTASVRHILLQSEDYSDAEACHDAAEKLLKEWRNGEKTEKSFGEMAKLKSQDPGSASVGGLYENVKPGYMVESFNDWMFDIKRKPGDTDVVDTDYGSHVMYYVSEGPETWKSDVIVDLKNQAYQTHLTELKEKYPTKNTEKYLENLEKVEYITQEKESDDTESESTAEDLDLSVQ